MFRVVCDPSSGSVERAWLKLLVIFFVCLVGVWQRNFEPAVCVHEDERPWSKRVGATTRSDVTVADCVLWWIYIELLSEFACCSLMHCCQNLLPAVWCTVVRICCLQSDALLSEFVACSVIHCCQSLFPAVWYTVVRICFLQSDTLLSEFVSCSLICCCQNLFPAVWYAVVRICFLQSDTLLSEFVSCSLMRVSIKPSIALAFELLPSVLGWEKYLSCPFINLSTYLIYN